MAELSPEPVAPAFISCSHVSWCGSGVPPVTVCCWHQPSLCLFWSQSSYVAACVPPSLPLGSVFLDLQDLRPLCALSSWLPGHHNGPSSLPESVALQASAALLQGDGVSFLLFTRPSCPLGLPHTGSGPLSSPCLWLIAELLLPLAGLLF